MGAKADKTLAAIRKRARRRIRDLVAAIFRDEKLDELAYYDVLEHGPIKLTIEADSAWNVTRVRLLKPKKVCEKCGGIGWLIWPESPADRCECNPEPVEQPNTPKPGPTPEQLGALRDVDADRRPNARAAESAYHRGWLRRVAVEGDTEFGRGYYELTKLGRMALEKGEP